MEVTGGLGRVVEHYEYWDSEAEQEYIEQYLQRYNDEEIPERMRKAIFGLGRPEARTAKVASRRLSKETQSSDADSAKLSGKTYKPVTSATQSNNVEESELLCSICEMDVPSENIACGHRFCRTCIEELAKYLDAKELAIFNERRLHMTLRKDPLVRFCPQPDCPWAVIVEPVTSKSTSKKKTIASELTQRCPIVCELCTKTFCAICRKPWHPGVCNLNDMPLDSDIKENYRACPTCHTQVNKTEGCNAVICSCGTEFCWLCGQPCKESVHFLPHKPCGLFKKKGGNMKARYRYGLALLASPLMAIPTALFGAGIVVYSITDQMVESVKATENKHKRRAKATVMIGTSPVWVAGLAAIGATSLLAVGAGYLAVFPLLFAREQVREKRQKMANKKVSEQAGEEPQPSKS